ncbi:MAG: hypothetical protein AAB336_10280 [Acidobacteriota bacterium]
MNKGKITNLFTKLGVFIIALAMMSVGAMAQGIDSTLALKMACETSPNNVVNINYPAKVSNGANPALPEVVNSPCTVSLGPSGSFETDQIGMNFAGPFSVRSTTPTQVKFVKSYFTAPTMVVTLTGNDSFLAVDESLLQARAGNLAINYGFGGVLEVLLPLSGSINSIEAAGVVNINGGGKFTGTLIDTQVLAGAAINVNMNGAEGTFKTEKSNLVANNGAIAVRSAFPKALVDASFGDWRATNGVFVTLQQTESGLFVNTARIFGGAGNINFNVAAAGNTRIAEIIDSQLDTNAAVSIFGSVNGQYGLAKLQTSRIRAGGPVAVRTGTLGETLVLTSTISSPVAIRINTGLSGKCLSDQNNLTAPIIQACQ